MESKNRTHLSIERQVKVIKHAKHHSGSSVRTLAAYFGIGKTQVSKNKITMLAAYESNASTSEESTQEAHNWSLRQRKSPII